MERFFFFLRKKFFKSKKEIRI